MPEQQYVNFFSLAIGSSSLHDMKQAEVTQPAEGESKRCKIPRMYDTKMACGTS